MKALVIGAGFGGISAALRLRKKGYDVELVDRLDQLGGRARVFKQDGFVFDAGPTVVTAPILIDELFELFGKKREDYIELREVDPWYRFTFSDGSHFDYGSTIEHTLSEIERFNPEDKQGYLNLLKESEKIFDVGFTQLSDQPFHRLFTFISQVPAMIRLRAYRSVFDLVRSHIKDPKIQRAFSIQPLLVGGNPFDTTCIYNLIHFLERKWGIHYAMGGTGAIISGLEKLMHEEGIQVRLNAEVSSLEGNETIQYAQLANGDRISADIFVGNGDPSFFYHKVLPKIPG